MGRGVPIESKPEKEYPAPRKQIRDLEDEKRQHRFTGVVFILFTLLVLIVGVNYFISTREGWVLFVTILAVMTLGVLFLSVLDGRN